MEAVNIVQPPLAKFYDALSDEQKARFNDVGSLVRFSRRAARKQAARTRKASAARTSWRFRPTRSIRSCTRTTRSVPSLTRCSRPAPRRADLIKSACPTELPATPPARLAAEGKRLQAMLQAVQTIRPALDDFYSSLSDDQKARFNTIGRQLFAEK